MNKVLLLLCVLIIIILLSSILNLKEHFEIQIPTYLALNSKGQLIFYDTNTSKEIQIPLPDNVSSLKGFDFDSPVLLILDSLNSLWICENCNLRNKKPIMDRWKKIVFPTNEIDKVVIDSQNNIVFVLSQGNIYYKNNYQIYEPKTQWSKLQLPDQRTVVKDFDASKSNFGMIDDIGKLYGITDYVVTSPKWIEIDQSQAIEKIEVSELGYIGLSKNKLLYICKFPCNEASQWTKISNGSASDLGNNSKYYTRIRNNKLEYCLKPCENDRWETNPLDDNNYLTGKSIDYVYQIPQSRPTLKPLDDENLYDLTNKIENTRNKTQKIVKEMESQYQKTQSLKDYQNKINQSLSERSQNRNNLINQVKNNLLDVSILNPDSFQEGFSNVSEQILSNAGTTSHYIEDVSKKIAIETEKQAIQTELLKKNHKELSEKLKKIDQERHKILSKIKTNLKNATIIHETLANNIKNIPDNLIVRA